MSEKLKPCPFCGGEPLEFRVPGFGKLWRIECKNCDAGPRSSLVIEEARKIWNQRKDEAMAVSAPEVEGRLADLNLQPGDVVIRIAEHDRFTLSDIGTLYDVLEDSPYFSSGLHLVKRGYGWTTMRDRGRFRVVSRAAQEVPS